MGGYLEHRMEGLEKTSLIGGVVPKREIDHSEVDWLELGGLFTHEKFTDYGMGSVTSNNKVASV